MAEATSRASKVKLLLLEPAWVACRVGAERAAGASFGKGPSKLRQGSRTASSTSRLNWPWV